MICLNVLCFLPSPFSFPLQVGPYIHELNQDDGTICQDIKVKDDNTLNTTTTNSIMFSVTSMNRRVAGVHPDYSTGIINIIDNDGNVFITLAVSIML